MFKKMVNFEISNREKLRIVLGLGLSIALPKSAYPQSSIQKYSSQGIMTLTHVDPVFYLAWSPDGKKIAVSSRKDTVITLWDLSSGKKLWNIEKKLGVTGGGKDLDFGPRGETVIVGSAITFGSDNSDTVISILSSEDGSILKTLTDYRPSAGHNMATHFVLSHDRSKLISVLGNTGRILMYDTESWKNINEIGPVFDQNGNIGGIKRIAWNQTLDLLALGMRTSHAAQVQIWDLNTRKVLRNINPFNVEVTDIALNPRNGDLVIGGSGDIRGYKRPDSPPLLSNSNNMIEVRDDPASLLQAWDITSDRQLRIYRGPGDTVGGIAVSPDGNMVVASKGKNIQNKESSKLLFWDYKSGELIHQIDCGQSFLGDVAFNHNGEQIAFVVDNTVRIFHLSAV